MFRLPLISIAYKSLSIKISTRPFYVNFHLPDFSARRTANYRIIIKININEAISPTRQWFPIFTPLLIIV